MGEPKQIAIIGGGITGLTAAHYVSKLCQEQGIEHQITLLEKGKALGGKIQTIRRDGFVIERGPDSFLSRKLPAYYLAEELGMVDEIVPTNPEAKKTYILHNGEFHRLPQGLNLGIPTELAPFAESKLVSYEGKKRALEDILLPKKEDQEDESLGHFLERRLGKEMLEVVAEPLLAGIYAGDTYKLSAKATFPQFLQLEQEHHSLILGMQASLSKVAAPAADLPEIVRQSRFISFRNGLQSLVDHLIASLEAKSVQLLTETAVQEIHSSVDTAQQQGSSKQPAYQIRLENGEQLEADAVIVALPAQGCAQVLPSVEATQELLKVNYVSVANVIFAFNREDIEHPLDGSGFVVPRKENRTITACTWTSSKWGHTAPEGKVVIRCYVGRSGDEEIAFADEQIILDKVRQDLAELMNITAEPLFYELNRWPNSMPQYPVGHLDLVKRVRSALQEEMPGVYLAGAGFGGVGVPDCIQQGKTAAQQAITHLTPTPAV